MFPPVGLDEVEEGADAVDAFRNFPVSLLPDKVREVRAADRDQHDGQHADAPGELGQNVVLPR